VIDKPEKCQGCPFYDDGKGFVPDELYPSAKVALLAQNPGDTEEQLGRPLIGRTGQMVMNDLAKYGMKREDTSYLNVIKCRYRPPGWKVKSNIIPEGGITHVAAKKCVENYLLDSLRRISPNVIGILGDLALYYGAGWNEVASWRGSVFIADNGACVGKKVLPMIHPAALYRDLSWRTAYKQDFIRLVREKEDAKPRISYTDNFRVGIGAGDFCDILDALSAKKSLVALDIETTKHKPIEAKLKMIGTAWSKEDAMNYFTGIDEEYDKYVYEALSRFEGEFITATPFDYSVLQHYGVRFNWGNCHDLTLLHSRFDIELPHDVGFICSMFTNRPYWKWMGSVDPGRYNALDCVGEYEAFVTLKSFCQTKDPKVWKIYNEDRRLLPVEVGLHLNGFPTDKELMDVERKWYDGRREVLQEVLAQEFAPKEEPVPVPSCPKHKRYSGKSPLKQRKGEDGLCEHCVSLQKFVKESKPINLRSRQRLMQILKADGMKMLKDKDSGKDSLAKGKVADLYKKYGDPRLLKLLEFWEVDGVTTRYFKEAWITKETGRIHPTYSMHSAMHRWHCSDPNMQQQRKPEKEVIEIPDDLDWDGMTLLEKHMYEPKEVSIDGSEN